MIDGLRGFRSPVPLRWSHHNYRDVRFGTSRIETVLELLRGAGWVSDPGPRWLTEGGLNLGNEAGDPAAQLAQARAIELSFNRTRRLPGVYLWTQHTISDKPGNTFKSGLRDDFDWGRGPGAKRPSWYAWRDLPGGL